MLIYASGIFRFLSEAGVNFATSLVYLSFKAIITWHFRNISVLEIYVYVSLIGFILYK